MHRRDVLRGTAVALGTGLAAVGARPAVAHEGASDGDGTVEGDSSAGYAPLGVVDVPGAHEAVVGDDAVVYVATGDGYAVVDVSTPRDPQVLARRTGLRGDDEGGPLVDVQDVAVDGDTLVVAAPAHPRRDALSGLVVVDVSDPGDPHERGFFATDYPVHNCDLADGRAYLTANDGDRNALVVVDVAEGARDDPVEAGSWSLVDEDEAWREVPGARRTLHDVTVHDGVAVCACWDAGTWLVDVADPAAPTVLGSVEAPVPGSVSGDAGPSPAVTPPGNHHYATLDGTLLAVGKETFGVRVDSDGDGERDRLAGGPSGVDLWDVSDPATPARQSTVAPPTSDDPTFGGTWTTAHNLDLRDGVLYTSWYQGGVKRHDVSDPTTPVEESWWLSPTDASFWTARTLSTADSGRDGAFVASSRGVADVPGRLYVFPDRPGEQADAPSLGTPAATRTGPDGATTTSRTSRSSESSVTAPGFGTGTTLAALGLGGWWLRRCRGN